MIIQVKIICYSKQIFGNFLAVNCGGFISEAVLQQTLIEIELLIIIMMLTKLLITIQYVNLLLFCVRFKVFKGAH